MRFCGAVLAAALVLTVLVSTAFPRPGAVRARFAVTLTAELTKGWATTTVTSNGRCLTQTSANGFRRVAIRSRGPSLITAIPLAGSRRVAFAGRLARLTVRIDQSGSRLQELSGPSPCPTGMRQADCVRPSTTIRNRVARIYSPRRRVVLFRRAPSYISSRFRLSCPGEASAVRAIETNLADAVGSILERDFFEGRPTVILTALREETTDLDNGTVNTHIRWKLVFRRLR